MGIEGIEISKLSGKLQQLATAADDGNGVIDDLGIDNISQIKKKAAIAKAEAEKEIAKMITKQSLVLISKQLNRQQILSKQHILKKMLKEWKSML